MQDREFWKLFESTGTPAAYLIYAKHKKQNGSLHQSGSPIEEGVKPSDEPI